LFGKQSSVSMVMPGIAKAIPVAYNTSGKITVNVVSSAAVISRIFNVEESIIITRERMTIVLAFSLCDSMAEIKEPAMMPPVIGMNCTAKKLLSSPRKLNMIVGDPAM